MSLPSSFVEIQLAQAIGLDIGGTKISAAPLSEVQLNTMDLALMGHPLPGTQTLPTPTHTQAFLDNLVTIVKQCQEAGGNPKAPIGIASAGIVNHKSGEILGSTGNLPAVSYSPFPIAQLISERVGVPVHVENDANAAAYGEAKIGAAKGYQNVVMITLGTGVGCGLVVNGKLIRGAHFSAGEAGHMRISITNDRHCTCGRLGCWEIYASGTGLATTARRDLAELGKSDEVKALLAGKTLDEFGTHDLVAGFKAGHPLAIQLMDKWHFLIAVGLGSLMNVLDPEVVVIGGGMAKFVEIPRLKKYLDERVMGEMHKTPIAMAQLGNQAGLIGAACLALETYGS